jgi:hypothetical protein
MACSEIFAALKSSMPARHGRSFQAERAPVRRHAPLRRVALRRRPVRSYVQPAATALRLPLRDCERVAPWYGHTNCSSEPALSTTRVPCCGRRRAHRLSSRRVRAERTWRHTLKNARSSPYTQRLQCTHDDLSRRPTRLVVADHDKRLAHEHAGEVLLALADLIGAPNHQPATPPARGCQRDERGTRSAGGGAA